RNGSSFHPTAGRQCRMPSKPCAPCHRKRAKARSTPPPTRASSARKNGKSSVGLPSCRWPRPSTRMIRGRKSRLVELQPERQDGERGHDDGANGVPVTLEPTLFADRRGQLRKKIRSRGWYRQR